jgi:hypothetical protein
MPTPTNTLFYGDNAPGKPAIVARGQARSERGRAWWPPLVTGVLVRSWQQETVRGDTGIASLVSLVGSRMTRTSLVAVWSVPYSQRWG